MKDLDHLLHPCLQCWRIETPSRAKEGLNVNSDLEFRCTYVLYEFKTFMCFCYLISEKFFNESQSQMLYKLTIFKRWLYLLLMCVLSLKKYIYIFQGVPYSFIEIVNFLTREGCYTEMLVCVKNIILPLLETNPWFNKYKWSISLVWLYFIA